MARHDGEQLLLVLSALLMDGCQQCLYSQGTADMVYENRMTSSYEVGIGPFGSITRDSHLSKSMTWCEF